MFLRGNNFLYLITALFILIGTSQAATPVGCQNQTSPCSGNGVCTRYSTCLCNTFYTGDSCEITTATDSRATLVDGGIPVGGLVAIVVGWIGFAVFSFIGFIFAFWRAGKSDKNWNANKRSRGNLPTTSAHIETDKTFGQEGVNNMLTEISHLNNNRSRFTEIEPIRNPANQSMMQNNNSRIDLGDDDDRIYQRPPVTRIEAPVIRTDVVSHTYNSGEQSSNRVEGNFYKILNSKLAKYSPIPTSLNYNQYSRESVGFANDAVKDIPGHLASFMIIEEDNDKTAEIMQDQIALNIASPFIRGKTTNRNGDDDDVGEEGMIDRSKSTRKYY